MKIWPKSFSFRHLRQLDQMSCGPTCLRMIATYYGRVLDVEEADSLTNKSRTGVTLSSIVTGAKSIGLEARVLLCDVTELRQNRCPSLLHWRDNHFVICRPTRRGDFLINDPASRAEIRLDEKALREHWVRGGHSQTQGVAAFFTPIPHKFKPFYEPVSLRDHLRPVVQIAAVHRTRLIWITTFLVLGTILSLSVPVLSREMIRFGLAENALGIVGALFIAQALAVTAQLMLEYVRTTRSLHVAAEIGRSILTDFFRTFLGSPLTRVENKNTGDFISRVSDQNKIRLFIGTYAMSAVFDAILIVGLSVFIFIFAGSVFWAFLLGLMLGLIWFVTTMGPVSRTTYARLSAKSKTRSIEYEMIEGFKDLKIANASSHILQEWDKRQATLNQFENDIALAESRQRTGTLMIFGLTTLFSNYQMIIGVADGRFGFGDLIAINIAISFCAQSLLNIVNFVQRGEEAWQSLFRLTAGHVAAPVDDPSASALVPSPHYCALKLRNMSFRYPGMSDEWVLENISLTVEPRQTLAIVGESGSGKTTLLHVLMHLYTPTQGTIQVGHRTLDTTAADLWRSTCGAVQQDGFLFSDTIRNNVTMSFGQVEEDEAQITEAIETACLTKFVTQLPFGLDTMMGREGLVPSGGQIQRILLARAIYGRPRFLFLDEATSSLDASTEKQIVRNLAERSPDTAKIIVAHRLSTVVNADWILMLRDGRVVEEGQHAELLRNQSHYHRLISDQLQIAV
ncbi:MAG: peptidase domain-containing ABC transporter [Litoreibacter sp.]|uniref:peptidase domain-containing ABC transporter n=1 Tax=Litoreibacter sp. TaxID=1969459 RepID=UPI0032974F80